MGTGDLFSLLNSFSMTLRCESTVDLLLDSNAMFPLKRLFLETEKEDFSH